MVAAALVLILTLKPKTVSPDAEQPGDATISEPADTPDGTDNTQPDDQTPAEDGQTGEQTDGEETEPAGNGISYTVEADALTEDVLNREIAVCGDDHLTNRELPYYYWQQYYTLMNNYGSYASYFIDTSTPFDQQMCMFDDTRTWQQYFLQAAITNYENVTAIWLEARLAGFQLSQEDQDYLDDLDNQITVAAASYSYGSADEYLQMAYGPAATLSSYHDFVERQITASSYLQVLVDAKTYTEDDISKYYDDNAESYAGNGIEKSDVKMVNVRHILIQPEGTNDDGTYTDEAWAAAEKKANDLLTEWKTGNTRKSPLHSWLRKTLPIPAAQKTAACMRMFIPARWSMRLTHGASTHPVSPATPASSRPITAITSCTSPPRASMRTGMSARRTII